MITLRSLAQSFHVTKGDVDMGNARIRLLLATVVLIYLLVRNANYTAFLVDTLAINLLGIFYFAAALLLLLGNIFWPGPNVIRRITSVMLDMFCISYAMILAGETASPFYGGYLWAVMGYGLRFGRLYLYISNALAIFCFTLVLYFTPYWQKEIVLGIGLLIWLFLLPLYVSALLKRLESALEHAHQANAAKSQFLANMSHELRTPLNAIIGYSEMLAEDAQAANNAQTLVDLQHIKGSALYQLDLINSLLDFARLEAGKMQIDTTRFHLSDLINEIVAALTPLVAKKHNSLSVVYATPVGDIATDRTKLKQALINLLSNANKFTAQGQITLTVSQTTSPASGELHLRVDDTGIGIAPDKLQQIFQPFEQADSSTTRRFGGTGLGLSITKGFIEMLGGSITVSSNLGKGATFAIHLPLQHPPTRPSSITPPNL